jgi:hypothetical protein
MRYARVALIVALVLVFLAGTVTAMARGWFSSPQMAAQVTSGLEQLYGGPVQLSSVDIGFRGSSLHSLKLYEVGGKPGVDAPWASIPNVATDVSAWGILRGTAKPTYLDISGADITLRFDRQGHLLTTLPGGAGSAQGLPEMRLTEGRLTLRQEGHPDLVINGIKAKLAFADKEITLNGTTEDTQWGHWDVDGSLEKGTNTSSVHMKTDHVHLSEEMLTGLPFISPVVWEQVRAGGDSSVDFTLHYEPGADKTHYRIALDAEKTALFIPSIDLHAEQAHGQVLIEDAAVTLTKVQGETAGGILGTSGLLDFRDTPTRLTFHIDAQNLNLAELPRKWHLPPQIGGRLAGHADLVVSIEDGKPHTTGTGKGEVTQASVVGLHAQPIRLKLTANESGFHFSPQEP